MVFLFCADHDRPLSKSGKEDAVTVSRKLQQLGWIPELILSRLGTLWLLLLLVLFCDIELGFCCIFFFLKAHWDESAAACEVYICRFLLLQ